MEISVADADIDQSGLVVVLHQVVTGVGQVVYVQKFAAWRTRAPDGDGGFVFLLRLMETADHGGQHVAVLGVVVVVGAVQVGGHHRDEMAAVLRPVSIAEFDPGDFGNGVGFVGGLQQPGEQGLFLQRLGGHFGVNAGGAEEHEFRHARLVGGVDHVGLNHQVVVQKLGPVGIVGQDAADLGRRQEHVVRFFFPEKFVDFQLVAQVQGAGRRQRKLRVALSQQPAVDGRTHHAAMAGNVYFVLFLHGKFSALAAAQR